MNTRPDNSGAATLAQTSTEEVGRHLTAVTTLDSFCTQHQISKLDFVKIDVEGYEERLLLGGRQTIGSFGPAILIEFDPPKLQRAGSSVDRLAALLRSFGYELWVPDRKRLVPLIAMPKGSDLINVFCLREKHRRSLERK
jgi:hypothetical protein